MPVTRSMRKFGDTQSEGYGGMQVTSVSKQYLNPTKLEKLLNRMFPGEDYQVQLRRDKFTIIASRELSSREIARCA